MSASLWPESLKDFLTSSSEILIPCSLASPSSHWKEISSCSTWSRSCSYSCLHCVLSCSSVTLGWPLAGFGVVLRLFATHSVKSGGFGTEALAPCPLERAATL